MLVGDEGISQVTDVVNFVYLELRIGRCVLYFSQTVPGRPVVVGIPNHRVTGQAGKPIGVFVA